MLVMGMSCRGAAAIGTAWGITRRAGADDSSVRHAAVISPAFSTAIRAPDMKHDKISLGKGSSEEESS
jgi:hypothetical protein